MSSRWLTWRRKGLRQTHSPRCSSGWNAPRARRRDSTISRRIRRRASGSSARALSAELYQLLAEVPAGEKVDQAARRILQAVHHGLAVSELALGEVAGERLQRLAVAILPVEHDHALDAQAVDQDGAPVAHAIG